MGEPFKDCSKCVAKAFCKIYSGEIKPKQTGTCGAKVFLYKALKLAEIPPIFMNANKYNFIVDVKNKDLFNEVLTFVNDIIETVDNGTNFVIRGGVGAGKTYLACVLLNHFIYKTSQTDRFDYENPVALFVDYASFIDELRYEDKDIVMKKMAVVKNVPFLLLDDVGAGKLSDFAREQTFILINHRFNHNLSTIITTNLSILEWQKEEVLGYRTVSRILRNVIPLNLGDGDRRATKK